MIAYRCIKPQGEEERFVGSAFCFDNYGVFDNFNCFGEGDTEMLAGSMRKVVEFFLERKPNANYVIMHFYKEISDKKELQPILDILDTLGQYDLSVIIITVNKTESRKILLSYFLWLCFLSIWHIACSASLHSQRAKQIHSIKNKKRFVPTTHHHRFTYASIKTA